MPIIVHLIIYAYVHLIIYLFQFIIYYFLVLNSCKIFSSNAMSNLLLMQCLIYARYNNSMFFKYSCKCLPQAKDRGFLKYASCVLRSHAAVMASDNRTRDCCPESLD